MFKVSHTFMIIFSGLIWFAMGLFLMSLGLNLVITSILSENLTFTRFFCPSLKWL